MFIYHSRQLLSRLHGRNKIHEKPGGPGEGPYFKTATREVGEEKLRKETQRRLPVQRVSRYPRWVLDKPKPRLPPYNITIALSLLS